MEDIKKNFNALNLKRCKIKYEKMDVEVDEFYKHVSHISFNLLIEPLIINKRNRKPVINLSKQI